MAITTRRCVVGDAALLHDLAARTFELACPPGTERSDIDAFIGEHLSRPSFERYLASDDRIVRVAVVDDAPSGYSMLITGPITDADVRAVVADASIELSKFYVVPEAHGTGLADALMRDTLADAAGTGATSCWLGVNQQNSRAARFYARHGFEIVGTKRFPMGEVWHDDHVRLRQLVARSSATFVTTPVASPH